MYNEYSLYTSKDGYIEFTKSNMSGVQLLIELNIKDLSIVKTEIRISCSTSLQWITLLEENRLYYYYYYIIILHYYMYRTKEKSERERERNGRVSI